MKAKKAKKDKFEKVLKKHLNIVNGCCRTQIQGQTRPHKAIKAKFEKMLKKHKNINNGYCRTQDHELASLSANTADGLWEFLLLLDTSDCRSIVGEFRNSASHDPIPCLQISEVANGTVPSQSSPGQVDDLVRSAVTAASAQAPTPTTTPQP